jgi:Lon protease-like protein
MSEKLPKALPIFPLVGVLLLPGGRLPLHVFEARYRHLLEDVLEGDSMIGVIQPRRRSQADDISDDAYAEELSEELSSIDDEEPLYDVGCVGHVDRCEPLQDGERYVILLRGVRRFRVARELASRRGYRRIEADYAPFAGDEDEPEEIISSARIMKALHTFGEGHQITFELDRLRDLPGVALLTSVAMALPFAPEEKQALLEAPGVVERLETLLTLMEMGVGLPRGPEPPLLN